MRPWRALLELSAGGAIGALLGLSMGLSVSPVVATIVSAIGAGLLALLNLRENSNNATNRGDTASGLRILGFGVFAVLMIGIGLLIRSHGWLSPSLTQQKEQLKKAGFSDSDIHKVLLYRQTGDASFIDDSKLLTEQKELKEVGFSDSEIHMIMLRRALGAAPVENPNLVAKSTPVETKAGRDTAATNAAFGTSSYLFAATADECLKLQLHQYADVDTFLESLRNRKGKYEKLAQQVSKLNKADREPAVNAFYEFVCQP